ncbi:MAG: hypothetical protein M3Z26_02295 [Bacteroidota bacterium]|nr:hypothetical protein [Bacteroidota bacterium]
MKVLKYFFLIFIFSAGVLVSFAQEKPVITKVPKFKPPVVKTFLGVNQNGATVTTDEAAQLITLPLKIKDDKNNVYPIDSYQFLYRKKGAIQDEETGKIQTTFTIQSDRFNSTPLPKIWIDNLKDSFQKDEQLYFFDIVVKDKEGRRFFAPELKIAIR